MPDRFCSTRIQIGLWLFLGRWLCQILIPVKFKFTCHVLESHIFWYISLFGKNMLSESFFTSLKLLKSFNLNSVITAMNPMFSNKITGLSSRGALERGDVDSHN